MFTIIFRILYFVLAIGTAPIRPRTNRSRIITLTLSETRKIYQPFTRRRTTSMPAAVANRDAATMAIASVLAPV